MIFENRDHKWVYSFHEGSAEMKSLLGGKGANLAEMVNAELPVPPGLIITTEACNAFFDYNRQFPEGMWSQAQAALLEVESATQKKLGNPECPLIVSVRSGAAISMPGMMETILNLGLNDETVEGMAVLTDNRHASLDAYRRFISMFGTIVMGVSSDKFDRLRERQLAKTGKRALEDFSTEELENLIQAYKQLIFSDRHGEEFPQDPYDQLRMAIAAVFDSWMGRRAIDYRHVNHIADTLGTAVVIQSMVFGNLGEDSGTGVAFTRNPSTGEKQIYGEYLLKAQGEDVVAGIRTPHKISELAQELPLVYAQLRDITQKLEQRYHDMQDIEFTIEAGKLWILQTRTGKRTGGAAIRIAVEMVKEGMIDRDTAVSRVTAEQVEQLLHPMIDPEADAQTLTIGLAASPGAATGQVVFDPDEAEELSEQGHQIILVRQETSPDDFHGMVAANAIVTARGGMTSHAAVVARGMGKPCIVGAEEIILDYKAGTFHVNEQQVLRGDWLSVDGSNGRVLQGKVPMIQPELDENYNQLMQWADEIRQLNVRANADNGRDAAVARQFGAEGIGLCRTEHMFSGEERLTIMREMILAEDRAAREKALDQLLEFQRQDFEEIFRAMDGFPVTIRLLDPPLHEFLPDYEQIQSERAELKLKLQKAESMSQIDDFLKELWQKEQLLRQVERLRESNPMLGYRGCRLGFAYPEVTEMQARAIFEAACEAHMQNIAVLPEVMIPFVTTPVELSHQRDIVERIATQVFGAYGFTLDYLVGTMIELPRAALVADQIAEHADFFSFGTNDLTQTTLGLSRDDSSRFLPVYIKAGVYENDPFRVLDQQGVGQLVKMGIDYGRRTRSDLKIGICGEHGGEPSSVSFFHQSGLDYVSCSSYRVPIARLSAAQTVLALAK